MDRTNHPGAEYLSELEMSAKMVTHWVGLYAYEAFAIVEYVATVLEERDALIREREAREAILTVVSAVRSYLPPDGDDAQTFASNVIAAVDNARINPLIKEWEQANGGA